MSTGEAYRQSYFARIGGNDMLDDSVMKKDMFTRKGMEKSAPLEEQFVHIALVGN